MNDSSVISIFLRSWPVILFLLTVVFQAGGTIYMILQHGKDIRKLQKEMKDQQADVARRLYNEESLPIYMPVSQCAKVRESCETSRQKEYDHLAATIRAHGETVDKIYRIMLRIAKKRRITDGNEG